MARLVVVACVLLAAATVAAAAAAETEAQSSYIVHVVAEHAPRSSRTRLLTRAYTSFLRDSLPESISRPAPRLLYSYAHAATGFAARLTERQAAHLRSQPSVLAVAADAIQQLHTTLTPSFLRLSASSGLLPASNGATDVVIGVIDTGIYPEDRASFAADPSIPPPPSKFRGTCVTTPSFNASEYCNNKLVGAKFFHEGYEAVYGNWLDETEDPRSPLDSNGHGTHTASTAAGSAVAGAAFYNYAKGKAVGMAPGARIAAYKVCWKNGCADSDILKAFDAAIDDGVDVISLSLGAVGDAPNFHEDQMAIGAFSAVRKGIVVSASAGNEGPGEYTAKNIAPWFITVGASTINRRFPASVVLGNGETFPGVSLYAGTPLGEAKIPLVYGGDVGSDVCEAGKINASLVAGKVVVCDPGVNGRAAKGEAIKLAGGAGAILVTKGEFGEQALATAHILPATAVTFAAGENIKKYIRTNASSVATIVFQGTVIGRKPSSPRMATFSSRGPNLRAPEILKPDITAPGVDILAAWTGENSPTELDSDLRRVEFNIISGTSMSCPHVSGIAALLRQAHPDWSPAAIKSALMTTAYNVDNAGDTIKDMSTGQASTPFVRGAGHVDPNRAVDPGLVYDAGADDYFSFLCAIGCTDEQIAKFTTKDDPVVNCSTRRASAGDLNYPAFSVVFNSTKNEVTQRRVVRNVGSNVRAKYRVTLTSPAGVRVAVKPRILRFNRWQRTQEYAVTFTPLKGTNMTEKYTFGSIVWRDNRHNVTSPIAITWPVSQVATM
ncbi:Subtilisin-like protease SBT1.4 [Dichanthelium oligosanthes]|uniref:Subtilisin-like protease SBT1.4 n=1 Tax=Dichanthelium oligosanthes TaxID=888268 RepID=A0A1E5W4H7_9POAL|nr:Subtilisin-like protease SBT1.4 [Dichanthelium oligosanthes]